MNRQNYQNRPVKKSKPVKKNSNGVLWAQQFTKRLLVLVFVGWVIGGIYGMAYELLRLWIAPDTANIDSLLVYFAVPLTCGIPSYIIPNLFLKRKQVECGMNPDAPSNIGSVTETIVE